MADEAIKTSPSLGGGIVIGGDQAKTADVPTPTPIPAAAKEEDETPTTEDEEVCPPVGCVYIFISQYPGSQVFINGTKKEDGLKRDTFSLTFAPVGERKNHPIILNAMYTDWGMIVTDDPKVAYAMNASIAKGNAQYFHYNPNDPEQMKFSPEVYSIATPDMLPNTITLS